MVRKRSKGAKRHYESDDEPETESDFDDDPVYEPAPKKYSLRQRKKATFNSDDWQYEEDVPSEDSKAADQEDVQSESKVDETADSEFVDDSTVEPAAEKPTENDEELVDFEDMIRADIVVNKNRIDYDNVIQKTEIKVQPLPEGEKDIPKAKSIKSLPPIKPRGKRGRKPKRKSFEPEEPQYFAPQIQEDENDEDYHPYKPKRTRKPKKRPAGEIDSSLLDGFEHDDEFEDQNDRDYDPEDDLLDMDYPGLSNFILDKQISDDIEESVCNIVSNNEASTTENTAEPNSSVDAAAADSTEPIPEIDSIIASSQETPSTSGLITNDAVVADTTLVAAVPDTTEVSEPTQDIQPSDNNTQSEMVSEKEIKDTSEESQEIEEANESPALEKVSSTSHESVIKVNEACITGDVQINGSVKHIEVPAETTIKTEDKEDDDDIVFIEEKKYEIIVLDD